MAKTVEITGKSVEDALRLALSQLGLSEDDVDVEVLATPSKGIFGLFGAKPARIRVTVKERPKVEQAPVEQVEIIEPAEKIVVEPPTVVNMQVVPTLDNLPKVDEEFVEEIDEPKPKEDFFNRDTVIDRAKKFLSDLFSAINADIKISAREVDGNIILELTGEESSFIIGKHGQTIDALQYLTNLAANKSSNDKIRFILDVGNYREKREETLRKMANSVAERAIRIRQDVKMEPMSRHDRRIVHTELQDNKRVETKSYGEDPFRYIVVSPVPKKKR